MRPLLGPRAYSWRDAVGRSTGSEPALRGARGGGAYPADRGHSSDRQRLGPGGRGTRRVGFPRHRLRQPRLRCELGHTGSLQHRADGRRRRGSARASRARAQRRVRHVDGWNDRPGARHRLPRARRSSGPRLHTRGHRPRGPRAERKRAGVRPGKRRLGTAHARTRAARLRAGCRSDATERLHRQEVPRRSGPGGLPRTDRRLSSPTTAQPVSAGSAHPHSSSRATTTASSPARAASCSPAPSPTRGCRRSPARAICSSSSSPSARWRSSLRFLRPRPDATPGRTALAAAYARASVSASALPEGSRTRGPAALSTGSCPLALTRSSSRSR